MSIESVSDMLQKLISQLKTLATVPYRKTGDNFKVIWQQIKTATCQVFLSSDDATRQLLREALEYCCILHTVNGSTEEFKKCFLLLESIYTQQPGGTNDTIMTIYAIYLINLLVDNSQDEFHILLERVNQTDCQHPDIKFATELERTLMSGNYIKAYDLIGNPPTTLLAIPSARLVESIRLQAAINLTKSHTNVTLERAHKILRIPSRTELINYLKGVYSTRQPRLEALQEIDDKNKHGMVDIHHQTNSFRPLEFEIINDSIHFIQTEPKIQPIAWEATMEYLVEYAAQIERIV